MPTFIPATLSLSYLFVIYIPVLGLKGMDGRKTSVDRLPKLVHSLNRYSFNLRLGAPTLQGLFFVGVMNTVQLLSYSASVRMCAVGNLITD